MSIAQAESTTVVGVFDSDADARDAICELKKLGFMESQIGLSKPDSDRMKHLSSTMTIARLQNAIRGILVGFTVGTLWGVGTIAGIIPGVGPEIIPGPAGTILSSAGLGAFVVGLLASFMEVRTSQIMFDDEESESRHGHSRVTVIAGNRADTACAVLAHANDRANYA